MKLKKIISIVLSVICILSLTACGSDEITATKKPFPQFETTDFNGKTVTNDIFKGYDVTIINVWSNGCGSCIEEMPELEKYFQDFKKRKINLIGFNVDAGKNEEMLALSQKIIKEKGVTFTNIILDLESSNLKDFVSDISGYPTTYIIDGDGNIIGAPIIGVVKPQEDKLMKKIDEIVK